MSPGTAYSHGKQALRRSAFALAALASVATMAPGAAVAQDGPGHTAACMKYGKTSPLWLQCEYDASVARTRVLKAQGAAYDAQSAAAKVRGAAAESRTASNLASAVCVNRFVEQIRAGKIKKADVVAKLAGRPITAACRDIAPAFGIDS